MRRLGCVALVLAGLALAPVAAAATPSVAEVRGPDDELVASAGPGPFAHPDSAGEAVRIGNASVDGRGVELHEVSLLAGRIWAYRVFVPARGLRGATIESLMIGGRQVAVDENKVVHFAPNSYVMLLQQAFVPGRRGRNEGMVGIRAYVGDAGFGVEPGTQLLVGLSRPAVRERPQRGVAANAVVLGVDPAAVASNFPVALGAPIALLQRSTGARAVALAMQFLGVPYVWGGADPSGFDCSGFVMYVYGQLGISLPHASGMQITYGEPVARGDLAPGDLVFFFPGTAGAPAGFPGHVGIYVGDGRFIHAPSSGDVVKISSLSEPGYAFGYVGATRPY